MFCSNLLRVNGNLLAVLTQTLEANNALNLCEQGVVLTAANIHTRVDLGAALANQDVACRYGLTVCTLYTQSLGLGITTVLWSNQRPFYERKTVS